jgi:rare lipoprotein A
LNFSSFVRQIVRVLFKKVPIATIAAWMSFHDGPSAAQTFDERWSIVPKAHAEPAPPAPNADRVPPTPEGNASPTPEGNAPEVQEHHGTEGSSAPGSENRSDARSPNRIFSGKASFYSYPTGKTASGATFNRNLPTAAHRSLPFGTRVRVTDIATNKSVIVVITDRGPNVRDRVLDLSLAAARSLGITDRGVAQVRVEVL